jgi:4-hydroxyphenylpyruvate dioxygenase
MSLGHGDAGHDMPTKLQAAKDAGFEGVEVRLNTGSVRPGFRADTRSQIFYMCLESFAKQMPDTTPRDRLRAAARQTGIIAKRLGLVIVVLQPILNYDGIRDKAEHAARIEEITFRMEVREAAAQTLEPHTDRDP